MATAFIASATTIGSRNAQRACAGRGHRKVARRREADLDPEFAKDFLNFIIQEVIQHHKKHQI